MRESRNDHTEASGALGTASGEIFCRLRRINCLHMPGTGAKRAPQEKSGNRLHPSNTVGRIWHPDLSNCQPMAIFPSLDKRVYLSTIARPSELDRKVKGVSGPEKEPSEEAQEK